MTRDHIARPERTTPGPWVVAAALALLLLLMIDSAALAHGIPASAAEDKTALEFVPLGVKHMLLGWDHLLFIFGVVLLAGETRRAAKLISLFVLGHSLTLIIATLAGWKLSATLVDVVIALSVVFVGVRGLLGRPENWRPVYLAVFGFGLVHGLGLSTRLQDIDLPDDGVLARVIAFNIGIEVGQLIAIGLFVGLVRLLGRARVESPLARRLAYTSLIGAGFVAALVLGLSSLSADATAEASCTRIKAESPPTVVGGTRPSKRFYEPSEDAPGLDLLQATRDGFVTVRYEPTLSEADRAELRTWITESKQAIVGAPAASEQPGAVRAVTAHRALDCKSVDVDVLEAFAADWFAEGRPRK